MSRYIAVALATFVASFVVGFGLWWWGYTTGTERCELKCKAEIQVYKDQIAEAERQAHAQREKGRIVADRLATELANAKASITTLQGRIDHEIRRTASATRRCMSGDLAGLLNSISPIRERVDPAPGAAPAGADAQAAAAATDRDRSAGVSEQSVATALNQARSGYETCRTGLHKLQDYVREITGVD